MADEYQSKKRDRQELSAQVEQFLSNGGTIQQIPKGVSGMPEIGFGGKKPAVSLKQAGIRKAMVMDRLLSCETAEAFIEICERCGLAHSTISAWRNSNTEFKEKTRALGVQLGLGYKFVKKERKND